MQLALHQARLNAILEESSKRKRQREEAEQEGAPESKKVRLLFFLPLEISLDYFHNFTNYNVIVVLVFDEVFLVEKEKPEEDTRK